MSDQNDVRELIIIGGGPAGYTAALYAARAELKPLVIEGFQWGGQLMITSDVENYPGYADGIAGPQMMADFRKQAERFGAEFVTDDVTKVDFAEQPFFMALPFVAPPDVPADRVKALQSAFMTMTKDPAYLAAAEKASLEASPIDGDAIVTLLTRAAATPKDVVTHYNQITGLTSK